MKYYKITYTGSPKGESGESCRTLYNLDEACQYCGTGARLIGSLVCRGLKNVTKDFFLTQDWDFLISEKFFTFLSLRGALLGDLKKVTNSKKEELPYYHLYTEFSLPKSLQSSEGLLIDRQCTKCKRNGYFNDHKIIKTPDHITTEAIPLKLKYDLSIKESMGSSDLFRTWEHFGLSNIKNEGIKVIRYARPLLVVSERLKSYFSEFGIKQTEFEEIFFV
jgi:hypothetical protein